MSDYVLHDVKFISGILIARNKYSFHKETTKIDIEKRKINFHGTKYKESVTA